MPRDDNKTYGFDKQTALSIKQGDTAEDREYVEGVVRGTGGSAGFYLFTLTGAISSGSGTGTIRNLNDDTEVATSQTIRDALGFHDGWQVGERGYCVYQDGSYHAIALGPYVTDLRITTANKYQRSVNGGATFADWASGEECD